MRTRKGPPSEKVSYYISSKLIAKFRDMWGETQSVGATIAVTACMALPAEAKERIEYASRTLPADRAVEAARKAMQEAFVNQAILEHVASLPAGEKAKVVQLAVSTGKKK